MTPTETILASLTARPGLPTWRTLGLASDIGSAAVAQLIAEGKIEWRGFPSQTGRMIQKLAIREA